MIPTVLKKAGYVTAQVGKWGQIAARAGRVGLRRVSRLPRQRQLLARARPTTYTVNGKEKDLPEGEYLPDIMHEFLVDFITRHKDQPFFVYYPMSHIHGPILRTPDSKPGAQGLSTPTTSNTWTSSSASSWPNSTGCSCARRRWSSSPATTARRASACDAATVDGKRDQRPERHDARRRQPRAADRQLARRHARRQGASRT